MTTCGFFVASKTLAFAWSDSEVYRDDLAVGARQKLSVSASGLVGIGAGYSDLVMNHAAYIKSTGDRGYRDTLRDLPSRLRVEIIAKRVRLRNIGDELCIPTMLGVCGFSEGRLRGAAFLPLNDYEATEVDHWLCPHVDTPEPRSARDVLAIAARQLQIIRRAIPGATGRKLTVAKIGPLKTVVVEIQLLIGADESTK